MDNIPDWLKPYHDGLVEMGWKPQGLYEDHARYYHGHFDEIEIYRWPCEVDLFTRDTWLATFKLGPRLLSTLRRRGYKKEAGK